MPAMNRARVSTSTSLSPLQVVAMRGEPLAAEVLLAQLVPLDHRAHGAVEHEDATRQEIVKDGGAIGGH
jgi:hypothetical protein